MKRARLDQALVARGLAESREKAQRLIRAGKVSVEGRALTKPGHEIDPDVPISVEAPERFVSRGGEKLLAAIEHWRIDATGAVCLDIGASTGGFTDCLLQHGAARVYAVDVGRGQLHPRLASDPRVIPMEGVNARRLTADALPETPTLAVIDASFISLKLLLPPVASLLPPGGRLITLIKPQFEAGRSEVGRGGVVRAPAIHRRVIDEVRAAGERTGLAWRGVIESPLRGPAGNIEFLAYWTKS
jgi:23S rRNA (cytidine1920-2'-O)/16S rRNA (cytidine1409-2'-O)-methyltransferase